MPGSQNEVCCILDHISNLLPVSNYDDHRFIPRDQLRKYLTREKIEKVLDFYAIDTLRSETIETSYLAVFVILLRIDEVASITSFIRRNDLSDTHLPFRNPDHWPDPCKKFFEKFSKLQWELCVEEFTRDRLDDKELDEQSILPIVKRELLKAGPDSWTYKIQIHTDYNSLTPAGTGAEEQSNYFVLKSCRTNRQRYHNNEVRAYKIMRRHNDVEKHIARFYGSWKQGDWYNLLLEYVKGNTLEDMFKQEHPTSEDDMLEFWTNLIYILDPLLRMHNLGDPSNPEELKAGAHQDIKPANILVGSSRSTSKFDRTFKLADLGTSYLPDDERRRKMTQRRETQGTQMFSAPECFRDEKDCVDQRTSRPLNPLKDVWSLACTFSETAVWCVLGAKGLKDYRERRAAATKDIPAMSQTAYDGCFHDGEKMLDVVQQVHNKARKARSAYDKIISEVLPIIEFMLDNPRPDVRTVRQNFKRALEIAKDMMKPPVLRSQRASHTHIPPQTPQTTNAGLGLKHISPPQLHISPVSNNGDRPISGSFGGGSVAGSVSEVSTIDIATQQSPSEDAIRTRRRATHSRCRYSNSPSRAFPSDHPPNLHTTGGISSAPQAFTRLDMNQGNGRRPSSGSMNPSEPVERQSHTRNTPIIAVQPTPKQKPRQHVTMSQVLSWSREPQKVPCPVPEEYLNNIRGTDQIFIVDTSASMQPHRRQIQETFEGLAYLVKNLDNDGMDLHLTTSSERRHGRNRKRMIELLSSVRYEGETYMKIVLGKVWEMSNKTGIRNFIRRENNWGKSIYVFTDGKWPGDHDSLCGIPELVKSMVDTTGPSKLGIQFIQFGNDPVGSRRLQELDEGLKKHGVTRDIIDTEHHTGNVYKMLLGHFDPTWDQAPTSPAPS